MQIAVLGPLEVRVASGPVEVRGTRLRALLVRLALDAGRLVTVETLTDALWGDDAPTDPANAVQSLVSRLRRTLPDPLLLDSRPGGYRLLVDRADVDALLFRELARRVRDEVRARRPAEARRLAAEAVGLWHGAALADLDAPYVAVEAAALESERRVAVRGRLDLDLAAGAAASVLPEIEALLDQDPTSEPTVELLMRALADCGRPAEALAAYDTLRQQLGDRLGADPSPALQELHLQLLRGETAQRRPRATVGGRSRLPAALTSFLGRDRDIDEIENLVAHERLVTLVGPGGAGKTRLAVEVADRVASTMPVCLVELAPVAAEEDVVQAVLDALDLRELRVLDTAAPQRAAAVDRITDVLGNGDFLLLLDNCEHLIEAVAALAEQLLHACPTLRVLATSREALAVTGERAYPVRMLSRPPVGADVATAEQSDAVRLFVDRARAAMPGFSLDDSTVGAVVEVCRRLDGLPLAIELAAARLRGMTLRQLAARLDDRFRLLTGGTRTAVSRHRTLRAVVEWSWDLLAEHERVAAARFAVFVGGATAGSVRAICLPEGATDTDAEDILATLADKSLLQLVETGTDEPTRYRMLETLREYGLERLADDDVLLETRHRHASVMRELAERAEPLLRGHDQVAWFRRLDRERDDILAALRFSVEQSDADTAVRIAAALGCYWLVHDDHEEAYTMSTAALATPGEAAPGARALTQGLHLVMRIATDRLQLDERERLGAAFDAIPEVPSEEAHPLLVLVEPCRALLDGGVTGAPFAAAVERALTHPDPWARAITLVFRAQLAENRGDVVLHRTDVARALVLFAEVGDRWGQSMCWQGLAATSRLTGELGRSIAEYEHALELVEELGVHGNDEIQLQLQLADTYRRLGDPDAAKRWFSEARASADRSRSGVVRAMVALAGSFAAISDGDLRAARDGTEEAAAIFAESRAIPPQMSTFLRTGQALVDLADGDLDASAARLTEAFATAGPIVDLPILAIVATATAQWLLTAGRPVDAATVLGAAHVLRGAADETDPIIARLREQLHAALGAEATTAAYERGVATGKEDAFDLVTGLLDAART